MRTFFSFMPRRKPPDAIRTYLPPVDIDLHLRTKPATEVSSGTYQSFGVSPTGRATPIQQII
jgi:hypothetical protein